MRIRHDNFQFGYNQMQKTQTQLQKSINQLASGFKINRAGDDAAGLSISEKMRGQIRGLEQSSRNMQDGISLIQTAEGSLNEVHSMLQRVRELTVQGLNGTYVEEDKKAMQLEIDQILEEIDKVANTTEFNGMKILSNPNASNGGSNNAPPIGGGTTPPPTGGGTTPPPTDGGTTTPPTGGGTTPPPTDGGTTAPPTGGGTTPPPTDGGTTPPPTGGGTTPPPTDGGTTAPPDTGNTVNPYPPTAPTGTIKQATDGSQITQFENFLKSQALTQAEKLISEYYGISGAGSKLHIEVTDTPESNAAVAYFVSYEEDAQGRTTLGQLTFNINAFKDAVDFNAKGAQEEYDRIVTHELVHATMASSMNFGALPMWFKEGTAELIHGADSRVKAHMAVDGAQKIVNAISSWTGTGTSIQYTAGYVATKYLHNKIQEAGGSGIKDVMTYLSSNPNSTLDTALKNVAGGYSNGLTGFTNDFRANGVNYINTKMNLSDNDTGAIGGSDHLNGTLKTGETVIPDVGNYTETPLNGFDSEFTKYDPMEDFWGDFFGYSAATPTATAMSSTTGVGLSNGSKLVFQVGANAGNHISMDRTDLSVDKLGLTNIGVTIGKDSSLTKIDEAINAVSNERSRYGSYQNRLEHAMNYTQNAAENLVNAESRIRDTDMAKEMSKFTKLNILQQATQSLMSQSNQNAQMVLQLLN